MQTEAHTIVDITNDASCKSGNGFCLNLENQQMLSAYHARYTAFMSCSPS